MAVNVTLNIGTPSTTAYNLSGRDISAAVAYFDIRHGCWGEYLDNSEYEITGGTNGQVTEVTITARPTIQMPRWGAYAQANEADRAEWDRMFAALTNHENAHHDVYRRVANNFRTAVVLHYAGLTEQSLQTES